MLPPSKRRFADSCTSCSSLCQKTLPTTRASWCALAESLPLLLLLLLCTSCLACDAVIKRTVNCLFTPQE